MEFKTRALLGWYRLTGCRIVHFLHIGKTGGNAIRAALGIRKGQFRKISPVTVAGVRSHQIRLADIPEGHKVIFTLRDPVERFVSGFNSRLRQGRPAKNNPWSPGESKAFGRFRTANELALALSSADPRTRAPAEEAMRTIEHVRSPFSYWLQDPVYLKQRARDVLFVAFLESLDADFEEMKKLIGLKTDVFLPKDDVKMHKSPAHMDNSIAPDASDNIARWYAQDYVLMETCRRLFGRRTESPSPPAHDSEDGRKH
jgi:hypothetical protein